MPEVEKKSALLYGTMGAVLAIVGTILLVRFPFQPMIAYGEALTLLSSMPVLFYFISTHKTQAKKISGISSAILWVLGLALAFIFGPNSLLIYVPDSLLLLGFFPLLFLWRFSWPWLVFGILNAGIGILLLVIQYSPDKLFPAELLVPKHHLAEYHPWTVWLLIGIFATVFGVARLSKNLVVIARDKRKFF